MDTHILETKDWMAHSLWVVGYGVLLTTMLARAVWLSDKAQHAQAILIAKFVAVGSLAPLGSWLIPALGGPWIFITILVALMLMSIAHTVSDHVRNAHNYGVANK